MKTIQSIAFIALLITFTSCQRQPEACIETSSTAIKTGETVTFTDCSTDSYLSTWVIEGKEYFDSPLQFVFNTAGTYEVKLKTTSKNAKKTDETSVSITVAALKSVTISKIELTKFPNTESNGAGWDLTSGPDVVLNIETENGGIIWTSVEYFTDATSGTIYSFTPNGTAKITKVGEPLGLVVYDYDQTDADDYMDAIEFNFSTLAKGQPATIDLTTSTMAAKIYLTWNY